MSERKAINRAKEIWGGPPDGDGGPPGGDDGPPDERLGRLEERVDHLQKNVATKADFADLRGEIRLIFERIGQVAKTGELTHALRGALDADRRWFVGVAIAIVGTILAGLLGVGALVFAILRWALPAAGAGG